MSDEVQTEFQRPDQVAATKVALERLRKAASKAPPTLQELAELRESIKAKRLEDDVKIVRLDGPVSVWCWLCKRCRANLKPGWFVAAEKDPPHTLPCDRCVKGTQVSRHELALRGRWPPTPWRAPARAVGAS